MLPLRPPHDHGSAAADDVVVLVESGLLYYVDVPFSVDGCRSGASVWAAAAAAAVLLLEGRLLRTACRYTRRDPTVSRAVPYYRGVVGAVLLAVCTKKPFLSFASVAALDYDVLRPFRRAFANFRGPWLLERKR